MWCVTSAPNTFTISVLLWQLSVRSLFLSCLSLHSVCFVSDFPFPDFPLLLLSTRACRTAARLQQTAQCYVLAEVLRCPALLQVFCISPTISSRHHFPPAFVIRAQAGCVQVMSGPDRQPLSSVSPSSLTRLSFLFRLDGLGSLHVSIL